MNHLIKPIVKKQICPLPASIDSQCPNAQCPNAQCPNDSTPECIRYHLDRFSWAALLAFQGKPLAIAYKSSTTLWVTSPCSLMSYTIGTAVPNSSLATSSPDSLSSFMMMERSELPCAAISTFLPCSR
jgi:hypothetical protein